LQFYNSQTPVEQLHIADAPTFELSKVKSPAIRARNIDERLAGAVAMGLRLEEMPKAADAARPTRKDLKESAALSVIRNGPDSFRGRKLGVLLTDGFEAGVLKALRSAFEGAGAMTEIIAPEVGGAKASDGSMAAGDERLDGAPSVLYDAVAILASAEGARMLAQHPSARDFVADAFAHQKFIAFSGDVSSLEKAGIAKDLDGGVIRTMPQSSSRPAQALDIGDQLNG
jgi:catalase